MKRGETFTAAVFCILRLEDRVLMLRRAQTGWMDQHFSLPAGRVEPGESPRAAAVRELLEESGVTASEGALELVHTLYANGSTGPWIGFFFEVSVWTGEPCVREPHKHDRVSWESVEALPEATIPYVRLALGAVLDGRRYSEWRG